ncbi:MAG: YqaE/Pmp3 family membrane protein [Crocinitomicaceae bacterium]|jgi:uncharacterized membrane protein YqaE (UPF0057 family)|nr:YqaE/Pmp3 family membrane protein [Crocinitomicaceae bacterium]
MLVYFVRMFFAFIFLGGFVACTSSSHVLNSSFIQKRKYQSGFHIVSRSKNTSNITLSLSTEKSLYSNFKDTFLVLHDVPVLKHEENELVTASIDNQEVYQISTTANQSEVSVVKLNDSNRQFVKQDKRIKEKTIKRHALKKLYSISKKSSKSVEIDAYMFLLIILACIIPPLAVLLYTDINWKKVAIALILCLFFYFPAIIYALLVLFDVL